MKFYRLSGELISSELPLDEFAGEPCASVPGPPTLTLSVTDAGALAAIRGEVVNEFELDGSPFLTVSRVPSGHVVRLHGYADYDIDRVGQRVLCLPEPSCTPDILARLFVHRVLPNVLSLRRPVLHASVVAAGGRAMALLGDSGLGKSTLASALCPPAEWMCDDSAVLDLASGRVEVQPGYAFARLHGDSFHALGHGEGEERGTEKRRLAHWPTSSPQPLACAFVLDHGPELSVTTLTPRDAVTELARHLYRLDPSDRRALVDELATLERLVDAMPVFRLAYPRRFDALADVRAVMLGKLSSA